MEDIGGAGEVWISIRSGVLSQLSLVSPDRESALVELSQKFLYIYRRSRRFNLVENLRTLVNRSSGLDVCYPAKPKKAGDKTPERIDIHTSPRSQCLHRNRSAR